MRKAWDARLILGFSKIRGTFKGVYRDYIGVHEDLWGLGFRVFQN